MFQALFAVTSGFLYVGNLLRGLARGILGFRNLHDIASHLMPSLPSPQITHLLDAPIAPLELLEELSTPSSSGGLIVIEVPSLVLPSPIPTRSYQLSLDIVTPNRILELAHLSSFLVFISVLVLLLPGLVYVCASIARKISAFTRLARKNFQAFIFKLIFGLVLVFSLVPLCNLVPNFFSTRNFSLRLLLSPVSFPLLWTGPPAFASLFTLIFIFKLPIYRKFSNMIVNILQRCGLLTLPDTPTPLLNATYELIVNGTVTNHKVIWWRNLPSEPKQDQTPTFTGVGNTSPHPESQYLEQVLLNPVTQHMLELEPERQLTPQPQHIYSAISDSQDSLRRQLAFFHTREKKLQADLLAAEKERKKLKDLIATLEASDVVLRADLATTVDETRDTAMMLDQKSKLAAEKDHIIRSTNKDLLAVRAGLQDAEDKIMQLDAELRFERKLRIHWTKELDEEARTRRLYEAEMRRISKKTEHVQVQLDLMDDMLPQSHTRRQSLLDTHTPYLTSYATTVAPDDTGQPPPPPFEPTILNVWIPLLNFITKLRPLSPKSLRQTPERNPHDPTTRRSPDHARQISGWLDRVSDTANSWRGWVKSLLETISRLEAERSREAESRERTERCLQEELSAKKDKLGVTQEELSSTMQELGVTRQGLASTIQELGVTQEELTVTKERFRVSQEEVSKANRKLDRERETHHVTRAQAEDATRELETCVAKLKEVQDARHADIDKLCEAVELLRQRNADLESLRAEAEASKSKHSQAVALSVVLQKRVEILEAEVKSLNLNQKCEEMHPAYANSPLPCPVDPDPFLTAHGVERPYFDLLPPPLPPSPPRNILSISNSLHTVISLDKVTSSLGLPKPPDLSPTCHRPPPFKSRFLFPSQASSLAFLPVGSSVGSVDWPPIGSTLQPSGKNAEQDSGVRILTTLQLPLQEAGHMAPTSSTSSTVRNPFNHPPSQITIRPSIFGDPVHHFGEHGSSSFQLFKAAATEPLGSSPQISRLQPELVSGSHYSAPSSPSHTPPGSPPMPGEGIGHWQHALKHSTRSTPEPPPPRLGLLDPILIREHAALDEDSPCAFGKPDRTRRPGHYRAYTRRRIPPLDYGLPEDFIPGAGCVDTESCDRGLDNAWDDKDFAFLTPLDCVTSTPVAISRRPSLKKPSPEPDTKFPNLGKSPPHQTSPPAQSNLKRRKRSERCR